MNAWDQQNSELRSKLLRILPRMDGDLTVRLCTRADLDVLAIWPPYPWPYDVFRFSFSSLRPAEMNAFHKERSSREDRIALVADLESYRAISYIALVQIDWRKRKARNMAIRAHPHWCDRGIGTRTLRLVGRWWFECMASLRLDVAASNKRAMVCYTKVGFRKTGEFWRKSQDLNGVDLDDPRYSFLTGHVRLTSGVPELRFWWMELEKK